MLKKYIPLKAATKKANVAFVDGPEGTFLIHSELREVTQAIGEHVWFIRPISHEGRSYSSVGTALDRMKKGKTSAFQFLHTFPTSCLMRMAHLFFPCFVSVLNAPASTGSMKLFHVCPSNVDFGSPL